MQRTPQLILLETYFRALNYPQVCSVASTEEKIFFLINKFLKKGLSIGHNIIDAYAGKQLSKAAKDFTAIIYGFS
jgi:hypothetical protein